MGWVFDVSDTALFNFAKVPMLTEFLGARRYELIGAESKGKSKVFFYLDGPSAV
jgi:hypothetical protein